MKTKFPLNLNHYKKNALKWFREQKMVDIIDDILKRSLLHRRLAYLQLSLKLILKGAIDIK